MYDAKNRTGATLAECEAAVGKQAELHLTGRIIEARESESGAHVMFEVDERWGFRPGFAIGLDLEALIMTDQATITRAKEDS